MKTIFSLVTKPINQNVAIIRISGSRAFESIKNLAPNFKPEANKVEFQKLHHNKEFIDDSLILSFVSPNSFTGEDVIEIQSHGSMFVVQKIISHLNTFGIEQSEPGEFMKQAYMNGKIDLSQSEAINTLILSENKELTSKALLNLNGKQSRYINESIDKLADIVSRIQVSIDYPENTDLPEYNLNKINESIQEFKNDIEIIINDSTKLVNYSKGVVISLLGVPNAGKSTLLNALLKEDRAIVSDIEGTTRDIVESITYINDIKVTLQDTAGVRSETNDLIEKEGIKRSISTIDKADIIIQLLDSTRNIEEQKSEFANLIKGHEYKVIEVMTKSDLVKNNHPINISAFNNDIDSLIKEITKYIRENIYDIDKNNNSLLITQNQIDQFRKVFDSLEIASKYIDYGETADVVAYELENAMREFGKMVGIEINQDYLTNLFAKFCIGK